MDFYFRKKKLKKAADLTETQLQPQLGLFERIKHPPSARPESMSYGNIILPHIGLVPPSEKLNIWVNKCAFIYLKLSSYVNVFCA